MIDISIKVNIIHIFHMNIRLYHHIFRRRFVYIHTFFHYKMMCVCRLITCLYDIRQTSYEHRLHHSHVAPARADMSRVCISPRTFMPLSKSCGKSALTAWGGWKILCQRPQLCSERSRAALYIIYIYGAKLKTTLITHMQMRETFTLYIAKVKWG